MNKTEYEREYRRARAEQDPSFWMNRYQKEKERKQRKLENDLVELWIELQAVKKLLENYRITKKNG